MVSPESVPSVAPTPSEESQPIEKTPSRASVLFARYRAAFVSVISRAPLSILLAVVYVIVGIATGTAWRSMVGTDLLATVGYSVDALGEGQYWVLVTGPFFGLTPWQWVSIIVLLLTVTAWAESRLGTLRLAWVLVVGQLVGLGLTLLFAWVFSRNVISGIHWDWPTHVAETRDVGMTTAILGAAAAASATLTSPWRLRFRLLLAVYVAVSLMFDGTLADVSHLVSFVLMLAIGERFFSGAERGFAPRTRREVRLLAFTGLIAIGVADIVMWLLPGEGPFSPTDSDGDATWVRWVEIVVIVLIAWQLRKGKRWAWAVTLVVGAINIFGLILVVLLVAFTDFQSGGGVLLGTSLLWVALVWVLIAGRFAFHVPARTAGGGTEDVDNAKALLAQYGGGTMSWMTTWEGNRYQFLEASGANDPGRGFVAFQRHAGVMIALTDPVCAPDDLDGAVHGFVEFAESSGVVPCWFSVGADTAAAAREAGWRTVKIAEDSIVDLEGLAFKGKSWQGVRTALNKAKKEGIEHRLVRLADEPLDVRAQVSGISDEWVGGKGLPEMGFTLGGVDEALDEAVYVSLAVNEVGDVLGVLSWLPVYGPRAEDGTPVVRGWTLDVMRRAGDGFGPVIEFLLGSAMLEFQQQGAEFVSLSGAPLAGNDDPSTVGTTERALDMLGAAMEPFYGFRSLHAFKKKFKPRYEPVFLAYRDEGDLPRIGIAISRAYLPDATPAQLGRMMMSARH